jgi:formylglycine-generating enzyme required for sulfatase activity
VHEEAEEAQERQILVPTMIDKVKPPLGFRRMQAAKLMKWAGDPNHPEFEKLEKGIEAVLRSSPPGQIKVPDSKPKQTVPSKPKLTESIALGRRTRNSLKYGVSAGFVVAVLLIFGIWWYISKPPKTFTNTIGMNFVLIQAGNFVMGSPANEPGRDDDEGQHEVNISKPFYLQTTEVSQGQWKKVMGDNPSHFKDCGDDCPIESVSWNDDQKFISKLNQLEDTNKYRLPTESEWEYACRAGTETAYSFGDEMESLDEYAWYSGSQTHPVGKKSLMLGAYTTCTAMSGSCVRIGMEIMS